MARMEEVVIKTRTTISIPGSITLRGKEVEFYVDEYPEDTFYVYDTTDDESGKRYEIRVYQDASVSGGSPMIYIRALIDGDDAAENCVQMWEVESVIQRFAAKLTGEEE